MDSNAGDYFPSFIRMNGIDHIVLYGRAAEWTLLHIPKAQVEFLDAAPYLGLDNIDLRDRIPQDFGGTWNRDLAMVNVTRAGENHRAVQRDHGRTEGDVTRAAVRARRWVR